MLTVPTSSIFEDLKEVLEVPYECTFKLMSQKISQTSTSVKTTHGNTLQDSCERLE